MWPFFALFDDLMFGGSKEFSYLLQYKKYFHKKLVIKYNILPNEYKLMQAMTKD